MKSTKNSKSFKSKPRSKFKKEKSSTRSLFDTLTLNGFSRCKKSNQTPIDDSKLSIREMKHSDRYELFKIVNDFRQIYYINVYKTVFRSCFTYLITIFFLGLSFTFINSKTSAFFLPPLLISIFLIWKISRYKRLNRNLNINELEAMNQNESMFHKYKSTELRRTNQGVLLIFYKNANKLDDSDLDLDKLNDSDLDMELATTDEEETNEERNKKLVGYLVYSKQKDELETVAIKEICIHQEFRRRKVASNFLRRVCINVFRTYGYRRVTFTVSSMNHDLISLLNKKSNIFNKIYSWSAFTFVPGVVDERSVFSFDLSKVNDLM